MVDQPDDEDKTVNKVSSDTAADISVKNTVKQIGDTAAKTGETIQKIGSGANNAISAIKWLAISASLGFLCFIGWSAYKVVTAPAKAVGNAAESVSEATYAVINRLEVPALSAKTLNRHAEASFNILSSLTPKTPDGVNERAFWASNLKGHDNRVCQLSLDFGAGTVPVLIAANNKAYETEKTLGSKKDRIMRIIIRAPQKDIGLKVRWDSDQDIWRIFWRKRNFDKPLEDKIAAARVIDILTASRKCSDKK